MLLQSSPDCLPITKKLALAAMLPMIACEHVAHYDVSLWHPMGQAKEPRAGQGLPRLLEPRMRSVSTVLTWGSFLHCNDIFTCSLVQIERYDLPTPNVTQPLHAFDLYRGPCHVLLHRKHCLVAVCHVPGMAPEVDEGSTAATGTPGSTRPRPVASGAAAAAQSAAAGVPHGCLQGSRLALLYHAPRLREELLQGSLRLQTP